MAGNMVAGGAAFANDGNTTRKDAMEGQSGTKTR